MEHLLRLADEQGLRVVERPGTHLGGYLPAAATIRMSPGLSARTAGSVLAHELAHAALGHVPSSDAAVRRRQERRADEWAARLLITPDAYADAERLRGGHVAALAFELGVTVELVIAYQRLLRRVGDVTYVDARMGRGQWAHRSISAD